MASAAQVLASQANARLSTGPRTEAGKAASSQNARTHGLRSKAHVILPGQETEFAELEATLREQFAPEGAYQELLFHNLVHAAWTQRRCQYAEVELQTQSADPMLDPLRNEAIEAKLRPIALYAARAERSFFKCVRELRAVQTEARYRDAACVTTEASVLTDTRAVDAAADTSPSARARSTLRAAAAFDQKLAGLRNDGNPSEQTKPSAASGAFNLRSLFAR